MRNSFVLAVLAVAVAACDAPTPVEQTQQPKARFDAIDGTGNPAIDQALMNLNNDVVFCATTGGFDSHRARVIAHAASILRFTPSDNSNKIEALLGVMSNQLLQAQKHDEISPACFNQINNDVNGIKLLML